MDEQSEPEDDLLAERYLSLSSERMKQLLPIWVERIAFLYANLWPGLSGLTYQQHLAEASELLHQVARKPMSKHFAMLEELEDKVETAAFAARFEANGNKQLLAAADIGDAVQSALGVFLDGRIRPEQALVECHIAMDNLAAGDAILFRALIRDLDYITGVGGVHFFRPLWPDGKPTNWPGTALAYASMALGKISPIGVARFLFGRMR
jgi:hypothetical protein